MRAKKISAENAARRDAAYRRSVQEIRQYGMPKKHFRGVHSTITELEWSRVPVKVRLEWAKAGYKKAAFVGHTIQETLNYRPMSVPVQVMRFILF